MRLRNRFMEVLKSKINYFVLKGENNVKMLDKIVADLEHNFGELKFEVAKAIAFAERLKEKYETKNNEVLSLEKKARIAIEKNREDLAMEILSTKKNTEKIAVEYQAQYEEQFQFAEKLKADLVLVSKKIEKAKHSKELLIAKNDRVLIQENIFDTFEKIDGDSSVSKFTKIDEKIKDEEALVNAKWKVRNELSKTNLLKEIDSLEDEDDIQEELKKLKEEMLVEKAN